MCDTRREAALHAAAQYATQFLGKAFGVEVAVAIGEAHLEMPAQLDTACVRTQVVSRLQLVQALEQRAWARDAVVVNVVVQGLHVDRRPRGRAAREQRAQPRRDAQGCSGILVVELVQPCRIDAGEYESGVAIDDHDGRGIASPLRPLAAPSEVGRTERTGPLLAARGADPGGRALHADEHATIGAAPLAR